MRKVQLWPLPKKGESVTVRDIFILTIAAGLSQCLIVDMMNDVMRSGLECFASKGLLPGLDFECQDRVKSSVVAPTEES